MSQAAINSWAEKLRVGRHRSIKGLGRGLVVFILGGNTAFHFPKQGLFRLLLNGLFGEAAGLTDILFGKSAQRLLVIAVGGGIFSELGDAALRVGAVAVAARVSGGQLLLAGYPLLRRRMA